MPEKNITVTVCGETFSLSSENDEEYVRELAEYVDSRLNEIIRARGGSLMSVSLRTALLTLNLADDLFKERQKNLQFEQTSISEYETAAIKRLIKENIGLLGEIESLKADLAKKQKELDDFIVIFGK